MGRLFIVFCFALCVCASGCAAMKERTRINNMTDEEVEVYNANPENTDKIVCKEEKPIGSNIPRRACHLQSWMDDRTKQDRRAIEEIQRNQRPPTP